MKLLCNNNVNAGLQGIPIQYQSLKKKKNSQQGCYKALVRDAAINISSIIGDTPKLRAYCVHPLWPILLNFFAEFWVYCLLYSLLSSLGIVSL